MPLHNQFLLKNEHRLLGLMLFFLLAAIHASSNDTIAQSFLIAHFGFFLLWQPVVNQHSRFNNSQLIILLIVIAAFIYWFNPWLNVFWSLSLLSMLTGRIFARGLSRAAYGLAVVTLFIELILHITPELFSLSALSSSMQPVYATIILLAPLALLLFPTAEIESNQVDFIRGFLVVILAVFLCMSSVLVSLSTHQSYIESLVISIILLSMFLLITALLWTPRAGFSGLAQVWEKYLLNIGGPFEQWITHVSTLESNSSLRPANFLSASLRYLMQQHWICGVKWQTESEEGVEGELSPHKVNIDDEKLKLTLFSHTPVGPSLLLHAKLLLSVLTFYYRAKLQEQQLIRQAHMQAIYETGSKLTHDVKNILQSTHTMTQIINDNDAQMQEIIDILKKQMPLLTQRLNTTLEKLRVPRNLENSGQVLSGSLLQWWNQLQLRYTGRHIEFDSEVSNDIQIPVDIITTVVENLLDNARNKRIREPDLQISVKLKVSNGNLDLSVTDSGSAIVPQVYQHLFKEVVSSNDGFGIGLYQSYELAQNQGYELKVTSNEDGNVCFNIIKAA